MNNEPVAYGMLTFCKNCGEQNPYALKELTDEEIAQIALDNYDGQSAFVNKDLPWHHTIVSFARALLKEASKK